MRSLVEYIASSLVEDPDAVRVREVGRGADSKLELRVARTDLGKVIGREGRTARAMRSLLAASGRRHNRNFALEIVE